MASVEADEELERAEVEDTSVSAASAWAELRTFMTGETNVETVCVKNGRTNVIETTGLISWFHVSASDIHLYVVLGEGVS